MTDKYGQTSRIWLGHASDDPDVTTVAQALAKLVKETETGKSGATTHAGVTVEPLLTKWLKQITTEDRPRTTLREYKRLIEKRIKPAVGSRPLAKLTTLELDTLHAGLTDEGLSASTVRQVHSILRVARRQGVKWRMLACRRHRCTAWRALRTAVGGR